MDDLINNKTKKIPPFISLVILYHNFVNISTVSPVRVCLQTRKDAQSAEMHLQNFENFIKIAFRLSEKLPYFFTIHYYLLPCQKSP